MGEELRYIYKRRRWKQSTLRIGVYTFIVAVVWHILVFLVIRVRDVHVGDWRQRSSLILYAPRTFAPQQMSLPTYTHVYPGVHVRFDQPPLPSLSRYAEELLVADMPSITRPLPIARYHPGPRQVTPVQRQEYVWKIDTDIPLFSRDRPTIAPPPLIPPGPAEFSVTLIYPSEHRIITHVQSSGDSAFDDAAAAALETLPLVARTRVGTPDDAPYYERRTALVRVTVALETAP